MCIVVYLVDTLTFYGLWFDYEYTTGCFLQNQRSGRASEMRYSHYQKKHKVRQDSLNTPSWCLLGKGERDFEVIGGATIEKNS
jgi:hypothetical protein